MTASVVSDPASVQRLGMLCESMERRALHLGRLAQEQHDAGNVQQALRAQRAAISAAWVAYRVRGSLVRLSGLTEADVAAERSAETDEPPAQLVPFVSWLRRKLGPALPWVLPEVWQFVGYALLTCRVVR